MALRSVRQIQQDAACFAGVVAVDFNEEVDGEAEEEERRSEGTEIRAEVVLRRGAGADVPFYR